MRLDTDLAMEWVETFDGDEPCCVLVWHKAPQLNPCHRGCEGVEIATMAKLPRYRWLDMDPMG